MQVGSESASNLSTEPIARPILNDEHSDRMYLITACTMVKHEAAYIVEWIEFMSLQGVERFIIYDDKSSDNITFLNDFYTRRSPETNIRVIPAVGTQFQCFQDCAINYGKDSSWMLVADVDEFLFSPKWGTLKNMLAELPKIQAKQRHNIYGFEAQCTRFSASKFDGTQQHARFGYKLEMDPEGRAVYRNGCGLQLITSHTRRGPDPRLNDSEQELYATLHSRVNGCGNDLGWDVCDHGPGKSMWQPRHVRQVRIHKAIMDGFGIWDAKVKPSAKFVWCYHFYLRSVEDAIDKSRLWHKRDPIRMIKDSDRRFWNQVVDTSLYDRWGQAVAARMRELTLLAGECPDGS